MAELSNARRRHRPVTRVTTATVAALLVTGAGVASAAGGGMGAGAATAPGIPKLRDGICLSGCLGLRKATVGGTVQASGRNMAAVRSISFKGRRKRIVAPVTTTTSSTAQAVVPSGAQTGKLRVKDAYGEKSELSEQRLQIHPKSELRSSGPAQLAEAEVLPRKAYFYGVRKPALNFVISSGAPVDLRVDLVTSAGEVVKSYFPTGLQPNTTNSVVWDGTGSDGKPVASAWYMFRISALDGTQVARASQSQVGDLGVAVYGFIFPIRGPHTYGDGIGAPRSGHTHQGQDVFAKCGTKMVAARGGIVQYSGYQGSAGNYLVIDGKATGIDFVYMHMQEPSPLKEGQRVRTGQAIGYVGESGNASGCHLHYEMWSPPGWYEGGDFMDPTPYLKAWDKYS